MNRWLLELLLVFVPLSLRAQDMIILRNGDEIQCKIEMLSNGIISYQDDGIRGQVESRQVYLIKYEKRGNTFFNSEGETLHVAETSSTKLSKKDNAIYLCDGGEIIASEVNIANDNISYRTANKSVIGTITGVFSGKKSGEWISISKDKVFLIRYFDGTRVVISDLKKKEEQARMDALPKVKHPFSPINKDGGYPCPADLILNDGKTVTVIVYDLEREYVHYRKIDWKDGPIFRMNRSKIKNIIKK